MPSSSDLGATKTASTKTKSNSTKTFVNDKSHFRSSRFDDASVLFVWRHG